MSTPTCLKRKEDFKGQVSEELWDRLELFVRLRAGLRDFKVLRRRSQHGKNRVSSEDILVVQSVVPLIGKDDHVSSGF